jgi:hypothetical protein
MGRMKIKKKEAVLPFRQTLAYRMLLLTVLILAFVYTLYEMVVTLMVKNTLAFIIAAVSGVLVSIAIFYNLDKLKSAKVPAKTPLKNSTGSNG